MIVSRKHQLQWEYAADVTGVTNGWAVTGFSSKNWGKVNLDTVSEIPRKGNGIQPQREPNGLFTWYRVESSLPEKDPKVRIP